MTVPVFVKTVDPFCWSVMFAADASRVPLLLLAPFANNNCNGAPTPAVIVPWLSSRPVNVRAPPGAAPPREVIVAPEALRSTPLDTVNPAP